MSPCRIVQGSGFSVQDSMGDTHITLNPNPAIGPTTFAEYYRDAANEPNRGQHPALFAFLSAAAENTSAPAELLAGVADHNQDMALLRVSTTNTIEVLHHFQRMPQPIGGGGPYAGQVVAISGDLDPDLHDVAFVTVSDVQFCRAAVAGLVPTAAHLDALLAQQQGADADNLLQPPGAANNDWVEMPTRRAVYAPYWVAGHLIGQDYSPAEAWRRVGAAILNRPDAGELVAVTDWLRSVCVEGTTAGCSRAACTDPALVHVDTTVAGAYREVLRTALPTVFDRAAVAANLGSIVPALLGMAKLISFFLDYNGILEALDLDGTLFDLFDHPGLGLTLVSIFTFLVLLLPKREWNRLLGSFCHPGTNMSSINTTIESRSEGGKEVMKQTPDHVLRKVACDTCGSACSRIKVFIFLASISVLWSAFFISVVYGITCILNPSGETRYMLRHGLRQLVPRDD